jgi:hypothetical protein
VATFDFITNDEFRASLNSDYGELKSALGCKAYKSVHVLAGSIIEAVLVDYLIAINYQARSQKDPLKMTLEKLIEACKDEGIVTERVSDLSTVIRSYRNLIHPARIIRLNEKVDENTATVAQALVEMIIGEIAEQKKLSYGYTAEQIVKKLERDPSVVPILGDILKETREMELERLLLNIIPQHHFELFAYEEFDENGQKILILETCYRMAFDLVSTDIKKRAVETYVGLIKNASESEISIFGNGFFLSRDMRYLSDDDRELTKKHIFHRLSSILEIAPKILEGIGSYLNKSDVTMFTDDVVRAIASNHRNSSEIFNRIVSESTTMRSEVLEMFKGRLDDWIKHYTPQFESKARIIEELKNTLWCDDDIPF